jgi:hypothetical protein
MLSPAVLGVLVRKHCKPPFHASVVDIAVLVNSPPAAFGEVRVIGEVGEVEILSRCQNVNVPLVGESFALALLFKTNVDPADVVYAKVPVGAKDSVTLM